MTFPGLIGLFSTADVILCHQNTRKTGNSAMEMSQAFQDIALVRIHRSKKRIAFNAIQNWEMNALQYFIQWCLFFVSSYGRRR